MYKVILALIILAVKFFSKNFRNEIVKIINNITAKANFCCHEKLFVILVGFSTAGKTTYLKEKNNLKSAFVLKTDEIHDLINNLPKFCDDNSTGTIIYWQRNLSTKHS